jgi:hypothetical protein
MAGVDTIVHFDMTVFLGLALRRCRWQHAMGLGASPSVAHRPKGTDTRRISRSAPYAGADRQTPLAMAKFHSDC